MDKITDIQILCLNHKCTKWFSSEISFGSMEALMTSSMFGNLTRCPFCGEFTHSNKENMREKSEKGGWRGLDTV